jgi:hypothetical protein
MGDDVCGFTFAHYRWSLSRTSPEEVELIHDVDDQSDNLLDFAAIEKEAGFSAKYFIRTHAKTYNPYSLPYVKRFRRLVELGAELGLHFEPSFYDRDELALGMEREASMLEFVLKAPIRYVSLHEPARGGNLDEAVVPSRFRYYSYDSAHYRGKKYVSESAGRWREGCFCQHTGKHARLIVLTHPNWWYWETSAECY